MTTAVETICVDIGNSGLRCVRVPARRDSRQIGVSPWEGEVLRISWPIGASQSIVGDSAADAAHAQAYLMHALEAWLNTAAHADAHTGDGAAPARRWVVSSVQRTIASHLRACVERMDGGPFHLVTHTDLNLQVAVDHPEQVGIDRLLAAQAALAHSAASRMIVIQAGSAITVDWVVRPERFCGGAIMPGVPMVLRLLSRGADLLPAVAAGELFDLPPLPGTNTIAAMTAGASSAVVGGVQHLIGRYREQFGHDTPVILSGGDGPRLGPHLGANVVVVDHLVLRGLARLASQLAFEPIR
ncbi:MAG: type III pantothenate kinase [Aureliella sp.]